MHQFRRGSAAAVLFFTATASAENVHAEAAAALKKAVTFYHRTVATEGGYLWQYSADLRLREGEGKASDKTIWVQPPGTPAVGLAYLRAWERVKEDYLLDAAKDAGDALIRGQLRSGGWTARIEFDPAARRDFSYRVDGPPAKKARDISSFDDNQTQSALTFLMTLDKVTGFKNKKVHDAIDYSLKSVLAAQHPNGAWSQVFTGPADPATPKDLRASPPAEWSRTYPGGPYWQHYTLNDNALSDTIRMLLLAATIYDRPDCLAAAKRAGDFLIRAQLPEPQPAWAQQYDAAMHPTWARKFEPPAVSSRETEGAILALIDVFAATKDVKYLEPIPRAIAWLKRSTLPDGQHARFYELGTNKPLFFTKAYELTYDDSDVPTHYSFKAKGHVDRIESLMQQPELGSDPPDLRPTTNPHPGTVLKILLEKMDDRGAWVEQGTLKHHRIESPVISSATFIRNIDRLSRLCAHPNW